MGDRERTTKMKFSIVVLISGNGTNLQSIIDDANKDKLYQIDAVISNVPNAYGLTRAQHAGIKTHIVDHKKFSTRDEFDHELQKILCAHNPQLIVLAGFMRRLGAHIVNYFQGKMINIHPSLLPKYPGLNTYELAINAGDAEHGSSVHFVTPELDAGPVIAQTRTPIDCSAMELKQRVQTLEHRLYPQVIRWFAQQRITLSGSTIFLDNQPLPAQGFQLIEKNQPF